MVNQKFKKMKSLKELQPLILEWAKEKSLINPKNGYTQSEKTQEELDELKFNLKLQSLGVDNYTDKKGILVFTNDQIKDDIGDILVTLAIQCEIQKTSFEECLNISWNEIKDRKGKTLNGTFIKE